MMTFCQYLKIAPKNLFESTLAGMMGIEPDTKEWDKFKQIMDSPYKEHFDDVDFHNADFSDISELTVLGRTVSTLPEDKQQTLREAMKGYCEVCDYINNCMVDESEDKE